MVHLVFPDTGPYDKIHEQVFVFRSFGKRILRLSSNCYYELYNTGNYMGSGGHRCIQGEAYIDTWDCSHMDTITIRLHWINPENDTVWYRSVFKESFIADLDINTIDAWSCRIEGIQNEYGIVFQHKMGPQLARQNVLFDTPLSHKSIHKSPKLPLLPISEHWNLVPLPVRPMRVINSTPKILKKGWVHNKGNPHNFIRPTDTLDLTHFIFYTPIPLRFITLDLGYIALHHIKIINGDANIYNNWVVVCYSDTSSFEHIWQGHRDPVKMADAIIDRKEGEPIGLRGCRYVHLIYPGRNNPPSLSAARLEYPFVWNVFEETFDNKLYQSCKNNLISCVDGGVVNNCGGDRVQGTGALRMAAKAIRTLTDNNEIVALALHQIALSYQPKVGMVQGAWPFKRPTSKLLIPPYHLAFCMTALEHDPGLTSDPLVKKVVYDSITYWKNNYIKDGIIIDIKGWNFIDWDPENQYTSGSHSNIKKGGNLVINVWWWETCKLLHIDPMINLEVIDNLFFDGIGYRLHPTDTQTNIHATAAILSSGIGRKEAFPFLLKWSKDEDIRTRVTPYFAYFIARALKRLSLKKCTRFIDFYYGPIAHQYNSIYEKNTLGSGMTHSGSIGWIEWL